MTMKTNSSMNLRMIEGHNGLTITTGCFFRVTAHIMDVNPKTHVKKGRIVGFGLTIEPS